MSVSDSGLLAVEFVCRARWRTACTLLLRICFSLIPLLCSRGRGGRGLPPRLSFSIQTHLLNRPTQLELGTILPLALLAGLLLFGCGSTLLGAVLLALVAPEQNQSLRRRLLEFDCVVL